MNITPAQPEHVDLFLAMRKRAADWLASIGSDQWATDWPDADGMRTLIKQAIAAGTGWVATLDDDREPIATWVLDWWANPDLWTPAEQAEPAMYLHRLIVDRAHAGHGAYIINWCASHAADQGATWLRLDAWTTNRRLHHYYQRQGFQHVRTRHLDHNPSGWIAQRAT